MPSLQLMACQDNGNEHLKNKINTTLLRRATIYSIYRTRSTCQRDQATEQPSRNNKQTNYGTNQPPTGRRPDGSVGMVLVLPALTDCWWWFESLLVHSGVSSATRRKATGADHKKNNPQPEKGRGRKSKWRVCVCCWGRQLSAILSHLSKQT